MKVLVTRHEALVEYFKELGIKFDKVISHATDGDVRGNDVYGVLPLRLASFTNTVTSIDMNIPAEMRGKELSLTDIETYFTGMSTYKVEKI